MLEDLNENIKGNLAFMVSVEHFGTTINAEEFFLLLEHVWNINLATDVLLKWPHGCSWLFSVSNEAQPLNIL